MRSFIIFLAIQATSANQLSGNPFNLTAKKYAPPGLDWPGLMADKDRVGWQRKALQFVDESKIMAMCASAVDAGVMESNTDCMTRLMPEAQGWGGTWCMPSMVQGGWLRSGIINPVMAVTLAEDTDDGILPVVVGTNSGGTLFATRYFALRNYKSSTKWTYPCYLLPDPYNTVCYFHADFGMMSHECYMETFNTMALSVRLVYDQVVTRYGGPLGAGAAYLITFFPFLATLPVSELRFTFNRFVVDYVMTSTMWSIPENWVIANTLVSPVQAGQSMYNFGYDSYLSRCTRAYWIKGDNWHVNPPANMTVPWVASASANLMSGFVMAPFSVAGKTWSGGKHSVGPMMKLFGLALSYTATKRMIRRHEVLAIDANLGGSQCLDGCPVMDGGFTDNAPLTPVVSATALMGDLRPTWFLSVGSSATLVTIQYLLGDGPMRLLETAGVNYCPFSVGGGGVCAMLRKVRELAEGVLPRNSKEALETLASIQGIWRPASKLLTPYCGDPLTFDLFSGMCKADSICDLWTSILPSKFNMIEFTPDVYVLVVVVAYLKATPVSVRFVQQFMPRETWELEYYEHMDQWFPDFDTMGSAKGGLAFTYMAGNALMDFMTYLNMRLVNFILETKKVAAFFYMGLTPRCDYAAYKDADSHSADAAEFRAIVSQPFRQNAHPNPMVIEGSIHTDKYRMPTTTTPAPAPYYGWG